MHRKIEVFPYDQRWPALFATESPGVKTALGENCSAVHHIGSTSVPGLAAKPIIDMIAIVADISAVDQQLTALATLGYIPRGEMGIPFRRFFQKGEAALTHHLHVFESSNPEIARHILFRDYLRSHNADRDAYAQLKQQLAQQFTYDIDAYISGKHGLIESIIQKSGYNGCRMLQARLKHDWEPYHRIRRQQIFEPIGVSYDLQHPTLTAANHYHFVFFYNSDIIGALHIELAEHSKCFLRTISIDQPYQRQGYGRHLLGLAEKWALHQDRTIIQLHARANVTQFYEKAGYRPMFFEDPDNQPRGNKIDMGKILL